MLALVIAAACMTLGLSPDEVRVVEAGIRDALTDIDIEQLDAATARDLLLKAITGVIATGEVDTIRPTIPSTKATGP